MEYSQVTGSSGAIPLRPLKGRDLGQKLIDYRSATITRFALVEAPSLFAIVTYFLTSDILFLFYTGLSLVLFFYNRPTPEKTAEDLNLDPTERVKINNPDSNIF